MLFLFGSKLKPPLEEKDKLELLYSSFQDVFTLPPVEFSEGQFYVIKQSSNDKVRSFLHKSIFLNVLFIIEIMHYFIL